MGNSQDVSVDARKGNTEFRGAKLESLRTKNRERRNRSGVQRAPAAGGQNEPSTRECLKTGNHFLEKRGE